MNRFHNDPITNILLEGMLLENPIYQQSYIASKMLVEYALNPDQIAKVFAQAEKEMTAGGANRTLVGKATDKTTAAAQAVSQGWEKVKNAISNSGPVSGFDQKFSALQGNLLQAAGGEEGAVGKAITAYRNFAKAHPIMQGAIYAGLVALAGISGAGLGGAALLGGIKIMDRLLQGDKASSALWQGFKTGGTAFAAGQIGQAMQGQAPLSPNAGSPAGDMGGTMAGATDTTTAGSPAADAAGGTGGGVDTYKPGPEGGSPAGDTGGTQGSTVNRDAAIQRSIDTDNPGTPAPPDTQPVTIKKGDTLSGLAKKYNVSVKDILDFNPEYQDNPDQIRAGKTIQIPSQTGNSIYQGGVGTAADTAKRVAAAAARKRAGIGENRFIDYAKTYQQWRLNEGKGERITIYLNEEGVNAVFYLVNEGIWDTLKGAAGKAVGAVKQKAAQVGANLTNKVTADKLQKAWSQGPGFSYSGQPKSVDSKVVQDFLVKQGVDPAMAANAIKAVSASNVPQGGGKIAGQLSQTPGAIKKRAQRAAAKGQAAPAAAPAAQPAAPAAAKPMSYGGSVGASMGKPKIKVPAGSSPVLEVAPLVWPALAAAVRAGAPAVMRMMGQGAVNTGKVIARNPVKSTVAGAAIADPEGAKDVINTASTAYNFIKNPQAAVTTAAKEVWGDVQTATNDITKMVGDKLSSEVTTALATVAVNAALPVAGVIALLYGGKKLYDYMTSDSGDKPVSSAPAAE